MIFNDIIIILNYIITYSHSININIITINNITIFTINNINIITITLIYLQETLISMIK